MKVKSPIGVFDLLPGLLASDPWKRVELWQAVEQEIRSLCRIYGFGEVRTPVFECTELFQKGTGEGTDIVTKEMYNFEDLGGRSMTLRPEGTPPLARAFLEHGVQNQGLPQKFFYIAPMFRYERPQAGRYRQHHQFGAEVIGGSTPDQDAELIDLLTTLYRRLGLKNVSIVLNSLGGAEARQAFRKALLDFLAPHREKLSADSQKRMDQNPLRVLDSKDPADQAIVAHAPSILDFLDQESADHFAELRRILDRSKIPYEVSPRLVRGLDYYNRTVFEAVCRSGSGPSASLGGGGRYDGLLHLLGGADLPATGFGTGLERIIQTMIAHESPFLQKLPSHAPDLLLIALGEEARLRCLDLLGELRRAGIAASMDFANKKLGKAMRYANSSGAKYVMVVGDTELSHEEVKMKEMATGEERSVRWDQLSSGQWLKG